MSSYSRCIAIVGIVVLACGIGQAKERSERPTSASRTTVPRVAPSAPVQTEAGKAPAASSDQPAVVPQQPSVPMTEQGVPSSLLPSSPQAGERIDWWVIASGGNRSVSTNYVLEATVGQTAAGPSTSTNYAVNAGYWQNFVSGGCCVGDVGNVDNDGANAVDIGDLTALIDNLFITFAELACPAEANCDGDLANAIDIGDLTALIDNLFITFNPLPACQ